MPAVESSAEPKLKLDAAADLIEVVSNNNTSLTKAVNSRPNFDPYQSIQEGKVMQICAIYSSLRTFVNKVLKLFAKVFKLETWIIDGANQYHFTVQIALTQTANKDYYQAREVIPEIVLNDKRPQTWLIYKGQRSFCCSCHHCDTLFCLIQSIDTILVAIFCQQTELLSALVTPNFTLYV